MSRTFDNDTANHLTGSSSSHTVMTMACWFNVANVTANHTLMNFGDADGTTFERLAAMGGTTGDPVRVQSSTAADTSTGFSANTWHHACAVFGAGSSSCSVYLDGGGKASGANRHEALLGSLDIFSIGLLNRGSPTQPTNGAIAWATVWDVELTDAEVLALAKGAHPYTIRPGDIVSFHPLTGASAGNEIDAIGNVNLTESGTVGVDTSPLVSLGWPLRVTREAAAAGGGFQAAWALGSTVTLQPGVAA